MEGLDKRLVRRVIARPYLNLYSKYSSSFCAGSESCRRGVWQRRVAVRLQLRQSCGHGGEERGRVA